MEKQETRETEAEEKKTYFFVFRNIVSLCLLGEYRGCITREP